MATTMTNGNRMHLFLGLVLAASLAMQGCAPLGGPDSQGGSLDEMTATEATAGFKDFTAELVADDAEGTGSLDAGFADLSDDVVVAIEDLEFEFRSGIISDSDFGTSVRDVIGDDAPTFAFAGFDMNGGPFRFAATSFLTDLLDLTEEQSQATDVIFNDLHNAIDDARASAREAMRDILTSEQVTAVGQRTRSGSGGMGFFDRRLSPAFALSDNQRAEILSIRQGLRLEIHMLHKDARLAFLDLLTEEQARVLDGLEHPLRDQEEPTAE